MPTARSFGCPAILITTFGSKAMSQALIWHNLHIKASEANFLLHTQIHEQPAAAANAAKVAAAAPPTNAADVGHGSSPSCWPFTAASDLVVMLMRLLLRVHWPSCCLLAPLFVVSFYFFLFATLRVCCSSSWCDCCCWDFGCCCCKWCCWCASAHCTGQVLSVGIKITWHVISLAFLSPVASLVDRCVWPPSENEKVPQWWMPLCLRLLLQLEVLFLWLYNVSQTGSSLVLAPLRGMSITWTWLYNLHNGQEWKEVDLKRSELSYRERSTLLYAEIGWNFQRK